jgi:IS5 family transposase
VLLQAAFGVSDEDAVEFAEMDRRWQMVLGTLGEKGAPFSQGTLFNFRTRLIAHDMDRRLLERTVELARRTGDFGAKALRAAFDASPLAGAGRVEDTFNLIGHAALEVLRTVAARLNVPVEEAATQAGIPILNATSVKVALDIDWDDAKQKKAALETLLAQVRALLAFVERELSAEATRPPLSEELATLHQVMGQDLEPDPDGRGTRIRRGVAKERRISVRDKEMRHGRKSKSVRVDGYKRHLAVDVESGFILAAAITPANRPEGEASSELLSDVERQGVTLTDLYVDRAYFVDEAVTQSRKSGLIVHSKAFPLRNHGLFTKADFVVDVAAGHVTCPEGKTVSAATGGTARFSAADCAACPKRAQCTTSAKRGRTVAIHQEESFLQELRAVQRTSEGRRELRKRLTVEHSLAAISRTQGRRARYIGLRKNLFDVRRHAAVDNLHHASRLAA